MKMIRTAYKSRLNNFELDVDFEFPEKGITVLFGPSGSGKSSLLNYISGLDTDSALFNSKFILNDSVYDDHKKNVKLDPWKRNIGYVFQDNRLFPNMTVEKNILFGYKRRSSTLDVQQVIEKFKISELMQQYPDQLSGGQKQRVSMVRALLSNPELLIMDEPLAALDYQSRQELLPYIECIHKELTIPILYVSHDIKEVLRLADYIVVMNQGRIVDKGMLSDLCISQPLLTQAEGASFVLTGKVSETYEEESLLKISCEDQSLFITGPVINEGEELRILIHAKDVSLCLSPSEDTSILNCIPVEIVDMEDKMNGKLQVTAALGNQLIVAMISYRSAKHLGLKKGESVFAQFKATAMIK